MKVKESEYEFFRETMLDIRDTLDRMQSKIGDAPMTIAFIRSVNNMLADVAQMYYKEVKSN